MGNNPEKNKKVVKISKIPKRRINPEDYQSANIIWLDSEVNNDENLNYQELIKKINQIDLFPYTETNDCINKLKEINYKKTFVIISGSKLDEFSKEFNKIIKLLSKMK